MEETLEWINEETEREPIISVREILGSKIIGVPQDVGDDLQICRFLRGNGNDASIVAEKMSKAIDYRLSIIESDAVKHLRTTYAKSTSFPLTALPHADQMLKFLPLRQIEGQSSLGLPLALAVTRFLDAAEYNSLDDEGKSNMVEFTGALLEMRALMLHNLSHAQKRMVKYVDVRDMTQCSIQYLLTEGRGILKRMKEMISKVQDYYPEVLFQSHIFNAPPTFSKLFAVISVILNKQTLAKVKIFGVGTQFKELAAVLDARAIYSWVSYASEQLDFNNLAVGNQAVEYTARWLEKGEKCKWLVSVKAMDIKVSRIFIPADGGMSEASVEEAVVLHDKPCEGSFDSECAGVLVLCIDNYSSWWNAKTVSVSFS